MELTEAQHAELAAIREAATAAATHPYTRHARPPGGKAGFKAWGRKLDALGAAWAELDHDTQMNLLVAVVAEWADDDSQTVPDLSVIAREMREGLTLPAHAEEAHPGLIEATKFLWRVWATGRPGRVPIDRAAVCAIAAKLASSFGLAQGDAERRAEHVLRGWDKSTDDMPGRHSGRAFNSDGARVA